MSRFTGTSTAPRQRTSLGHHRWPTWIRWPAQPSSTAAPERPLLLAILRTDIERALDDLASQEEGMRFQGLAVVLGKKRWPELIARQRKKDSGLDAYAPASLTPERVGKGLAASITP